MKRIITLSLALLVLLTSISGADLSATASALDEGVKTEGYTELPEQLSDILYVIYPLPEPVDFPRGGPGGFYFKSYLWNIDELAKGTADCPTWAVDNLNSEEAVAAAMEKLKNYDYSAVVLDFDFDSDTLSKVSVQPDISKPLDFTGGPIDFKISLKSDPEIFVEFTCAFSKYQNKEPYTTHNLPSTMKIGEAISNLPDYRIYFCNLTPGRTIAASHKATWNPGNIEISYSHYANFGQHAGGDPFEDVDENGTVKYFRMWYFNTFFRPGTLTVQPFYQYRDPDTWEELGDDIAIGTPISIQVEEPVIKTNAPESIEVGSTLQFTSELTNTALINKDTAYYLDESNYSRGVYENGNQWGQLKDDDTHDSHEPAYQPSVEILEGKELVSRSNQDYSNTLRSCETLTFTGTGTVKLRVRYNQFITCIDCQSVYDENYKQTGEYYTYNPEKTITIQVTNGNGEVSLPGDLDGNGKRTVSDVVELRGIVIAGNPTRWQMACGDLDGDGKLTVSDVVALRREIMKG